MLWVAGGNPRSPALSDNPVFTTFICLTTVRLESTTIKLLTTTDWKFHWTRIMYNIIKPNKIEDVMRPLFPEDTIPILLIITLPQKCQ